jgi:release factor glutamine methyltransferase
MRASDLYHELLERLRARFVSQPDKLDETPESTLDALWSLAQGAPCSARMARAAHLAPLDTEQVLHLRALVERRLEGRPLAHITGRQHFMGLELLCGPDALVPRIETEMLARAAIEIAGTLQRGDAGPRILDACTGCGNVALALAGHVAPAIIGACDLSGEAIALARRNARHTGLSTRVEFRTGDLLAPFRDGEWNGAVDLLTCNPPYISSAKVPEMAGEIASHEPAMAFDGGPFGVSILMRLLQDAPEMLRPGGWLAFEVGLGQGPAMQKRLKSSGNFSAIRTHADAAGHIRVIAAQRGDGG